MFRFLLFVTFFALCSAVCEDKDADCVNKAWGCYSSDPTYLAWIRDLCPKTCKVCSDGNVGGNCQDKTIVKCDRQFCDDARIAYDTKHWLCQKTCNLC
uniref:ShKT domain-containing protein n=1 Tax=Steinernema glaseri TaxID=37863 RepID=A0A1I7YUC0_9BILA